MQNENLDENKPAQFDNNDEPSLFDGLEDEEQDNDQ